MFREMRRNKQALAINECEEILNNCTSGVLAVSGDDGYPYAVPLSYVYADNKLYFHCANTGHKIDAIKSNCKVSFCVTAQDKVVAERFLTRYKSVIAFGKAIIIEDETEKRNALEIIADKYSPNEPGTQKEIDGFINNVCIIEVMVDHLTGKQAKELANNG